MCAHLKRTLMRGSGRVDEGSMNAAAFVVCAVVAWAWFTR